VIYWQTGGEQTTTVYARRQCPCTSLGRCPLPPFRLSCFHGPTSASRK